MNNSFSEPVRCGYCGLPYKDMSSVQKHQSMVHNFEEKLYLAKCDENSGQVGEKGIEILKYIIRLSVRRAQKEI